MQWHLDEQEKSVHITVQKALTASEVMAILQLVEAKYEAEQKDIIIQFIETTLSTTSIQKPCWQLELCQHIFILDAVKAASLSSFQRVPLKKEFTVAPISELTEQERVDINLGIDVWLHPRFNPLHYTEVASNSKILRHKGELIGWCIVVGASDQMLMYDNVFVKVPYQGLGRAMLLFWHALNEQLQTMPQRYITFVVDGHNQSMIKLLQKKVTASLIDYQKVTVLRYTKV